VSDAKGECLADNFDFTDSTTFFVSSYDWLESIEPQSTPAKSSCVALAVKQKVSKSAFTFVKC